MPTKRYPLEDGGEDRVELSWGRKFRNFTVTVDGQRLNPEPFDREDLEAGQKLPLNDGTTLHIKFDKGFSGGLKVTRDLKPLPGSPTHPVTRAKTASIIMFVIAGLSAAFLGVLVGTEDIPALVLTTQGAWILVFLVLGILVRKGFLAALWAGIILYGVDTVALLITGGLDIFWIFIRGLLLVAMWQALPALRQLKEERTEAAGV